MRTGGEDLLVERSDPSVALIIDGTIAAPVLVGEGALVVLPSIPELVIDGTVVALLADEAGLLLDTLRLSVSMVELVIGPLRVLGPVESAGRAVVEIMELKLDAVD